ncbi:MAG: hypothetical protein PHT60_06540 [Acidiphilium sp.]|nr:hypothetical protein [Acidiphilium sp.]MDD4935422.1 hypothetical protein [Acidiphilium sp.]
MTDARWRDNNETAPPDSEPDLASLARDWITLWQSELTAMAQDRECREAWTGLLAIWAGAATAAFAATDAARRHDTLRRTRPDGSPRPPPDPAASDAGRNAIERLNRRIAELEARLAALELGDRPIQS